MAASETVAQSVAAISGQGRRRAEQFFATAWQSAPGVYQRRMAAHIEIGFADLLDVLSEVFAVPVDGRKALTSRLKHLQGKSFPPGVNVGRGGRVRYNLEAVMGTVLVLTLTSAFIPPNQAVEVVRRNWDKWLELLREAASLQSDKGRASKPDSDVIAVIESNALADLGAAKATEGRAAGTRGALSFRVSGRDGLAASGGSARGAATLVDVPAVLARAAPPIANAASCEPADVFEALAAR